MARRTPTIPLATTLLWAAGLPLLAQDGVAPPPDGGTGPVAPTPVTVQVEPTPEPTRDHDPAALAVLDEAISAIEGLGSFRATLTCVGAGVFKDTSERGSVQVIARRAPDDPARWQLRLTGPMTPEREVDPIEIDASFDGQRLRYADREERTIGARILPVRILRPWFTVPVGLREDRLWIHSLPADMLRTASRLSLEARETIDGVECDVVRADMPSNIEYYRVFIGVEDRLPRRHVRGFDSRNVAQSLPMTGFEQTDYQGVDINPPITDADLAIAVPEGWTEQRFPDQVVTPPLITDPGDIARAREEGMEGDGSAGEDEASMSESGEDSSGPAPVRPAASARAQDFTLKDPAGADVSLAQFRGSPVVLVFWGSWNPWARDLLAQVGPIVADAGDARLLVLAVRERSRESAQQRHQQQGSPGTLLLGADQVAGEYQVAAVPTVVVVGPDGRILLRESGFEPDSDLAERIAETLSAP